MDYDKLHLESIEAYAERVRLAYEKAIEEIGVYLVYARLSSNGDLLFIKKEYVKKAVGKILDNMFEQVYVETVTGITTNWDLAVEKNNAVAERVFGAKLEELPTEYKEKYLSNNQTAKEAFISRKDTQFTISDRVWKNTQQFKNEMELIIETGLKNGDSADDLVKNMKQYLREPDKLFRRIRNTETGALELSKAAKAYHPGQGVYRSSYKNAHRLLRNEINASYERAAYLKRQQQEFVVGIEIKTSPQHDPSDDKGGISCQALVGRYPKDFDWTWKWHVNCLCMCLDVVKTQDEIFEDVARIGNGEKPSLYSSQLVADFPPNYKQYVAENRTKWEKHKNPPRWIK